MFIIATIGSLTLYIAILISASRTDLPFYIMLNNPLIANSPLGGLEIWISLAIKYWAWTLIPVSTSILAFLFYRGAINIAFTYGTALKTAFDLQRFELLKALHLPLPTDSVHEKITNEILLALQVPFNSKTNIASDLNYYVDYLMTIMYFSMSVY